MFQLLSLISLLAAPAHADAPAPGVILWVTPSLPGPDVSGKAARLTDGATPYAWGDYAFARGEETEGDRARLLAVGTAMDTAKKRWNDFDVEEGIAQQINTAVDGVEILRSDDDRRAVVQALLLSGLASQKAFPESRFGLLEAAAPFRAMVAARAVQRAWVDALALEPDTVWTRKEVDDATGLAGLLALQNDLRSLPKAKLALPPRPKGVTLYVDGRALADDLTSLDLPLGHHFLHAMVGTRLAGRAEVTLEAGQAATFPMAVDEATLRDARTKVLAEDPGVPDALMAAIGYYRTVGGRPSRLFLGAIDDNGKAHILPFAGGAALVRPKPFSALLAGDIDGGFLLSSAFSENEGTRVTAPAFGPNLSLQLGVYNAMVLGGASMYITPGRAMAWNASSDPTIAPVYVRPYVGIGAYFPRPTARMPLLQAAVTYGWFLPGSSGIGGMFGCGIPVKQEGTWIRISVDAYSGVQGPGQVETGSKTVAGSLRIGFERKL